jgi:stage II sporulation protein M
MKRKKRKLKKRVRKVTKAKPLKKVSKKREKTKKKFTLLGEYGNALSFIRESRDFIYIAILLFLIFCVIGFFFQDLINAFFASFFDVDLNKVILDYIQQILEETEGMGHGQLVGYIFFRNLQSSLLGLLLGIILGIFPIVALLANGYLLGFVALISVKAHGIQVLWRLFPHGIFELPAIFISLGLGIRLGFSIFSSDKKKSFKKSFLGALRVFLLIVFPLLIIAAIIEATLIYFLP